MNISSCKFESCPGHKGLAKADPFFCAWTRRERKFGQSEQRAQSRASTSYAESREIEDKRSAVNFVLGTEGLAKADPFLFL